MTRDQGDLRGARTSSSLAWAQARSRVLYGGITVFQVLADVAFLAREWRVRVEVFFAFVGVVRELVMLGLSLLLSGYTTGDERGMWGRTVGGQRLEGLRDAHHELVRDVAETLDLAFKLGDLVLESVIFLFDVKDVRTG